MRPFALLALLSVLTLTACSTQRTEALQRRQNWMNNQADAAAERRAIRSQNMDDRVQATFDAM
jgi:hypothetical protein